MGTLPPQALDISPDTSFYKQAVKNLLAWARGDDFFTCRLFSLMMKADHPNFTKLATAFPLEARVLYDWYSSPDPEKFFEELGGRE